jgi:hypothetical protein
MESYIDVTNKAMEMGIRLPVYLHKNVRIFGMNLYHYTGEETPLDRVEEILGKLKANIEVIGVGNKKRFRFCAEYKKESVELEVINTDNIIKVKRLISSS